MGIFGLILTFLVLGFLQIVGVICIPQSGPNKGPELPSSFSHASLPSQQPIPASTEPPKFWNVRWNGQEKISQFKRVNLDKMLNAALYTGTQSDWKDQKLFTFFTNVWTYMTKTYGNFGPDIYLSLVIHENRISGSHQEPIYGFSVNLQNPYERNVLNMGSFNFHPTEWEIRHYLKNTERDKLLNSLAYFVEYSSKNRLGSPSYNVWKTDDSKGRTATAWVDIFTYDVYKNLNLTQDSERYKKTSEHSFSMYPKSETFWFKIWFLPIYERYGGNAVLNKYFDLLRDHFPTEAEKPYKYDGSLDMGGFVHFWSGAAGENLKAIAQRAFGWTEDFEEQFLRAREEFPGLNLLYNDTLAPDPSNAGKTLEPDHETVLEKRNHSGIDFMLPVETTTPHSGNSTSSITETRAKETEGTSMEQGNIVAIGAGIGGTIVLLLFLGLVASLVFQIRKNKTMSVPLRLSLAAEAQNLTDKEVMAFFEGDPDVDPESNYALAQSKPFIMDYEVPRDHMNLDPKAVLGKGQFGSVVSGRLLVKNDEWLTVAVKTVKENVDVEYFQAFLSEVKIMAYIGKHANIVELHGTCTTNIKNCEILIALEFCLFGSLHNYLKRNRNIFEDEKFSITTTLPGSANTTEASLATKITTSDLLKWSREIANGMAYLTVKKVIHGDLAARNVLLTKDRVAKISDFGLSRQFLNYANYQKTSTLPLPWRWMAVESLKQMEFSVASDVWAFGVTMWEIFSLAEVPYSCWTWDLHFVDKLMSGDRLLRPINANPDIYNLMMDCWKLKPADRPSFQHIYDTLNNHILQYIL